MNINKFSSSGVQIINYNIHTELKIKLYMLIQHTLTIILAIKLIIIYL